MKFIIELIFLIILFASIWTGYKKGFIAGIATLLSIIISICVGNLFAETFSPELEKAIHPFIRGYMEGSVGTSDDTIVEIFGEGQSISVDDAVEKNPDIAFELCEKSFISMGLYPRPAKNLAKTVIREYSESNSGISAAIIGVMSDAIAYLLAFLVFFSLALLILTVILNLLQLKIDIPKLDKYNSIGGIASGVLVGTLFCSLTAWILKFADLLIANNKIGAILIGNLFMRADIFSIFLPY